MPVQRRIVHSLDEQDEPYRNLDHETDVEYGKKRRRGRCICGWRGPWHWANAYEAIGDTDDHMNEMT
jgi:hypothetical protein